MKRNGEELFVGIDLGWKNKKTTGVCVLEKKGETLFPSESWCKLCQDVHGKEVLKKIRKYLKKTKVIAIDAPLTKGRGKGKMRLYEKFLSTKIFRQERVNPIPPALMPELCDFSQELVEKLEKRGFVLDLNLIEVFPTMINRICNQNLLLNITKNKKEVFTCKNENQRSALVCAILAFLHSHFKTRYLGYRDGFLFLPEMNFWKKEWRQKFYQTWVGRDRLKYHHLITNIFNRSGSRENFSLLSK